MHNPKPQPSPAPLDDSIYERRESVVRSYCRSMPRQFGRAEGAYLYDSAGGRYLDFLSGCSALNYGHNHPVLKRALLDYIEGNGIAHGLDFHTDAKRAFLKALDEQILGPRGLNHRAMFTGPTGANAIEAAIKLARKATGRQLVVAFTNGFHGMTLGALSCTGNRHKRQGAGVPLEQVEHAPFDGYHGAGIDTADLLARRLADPSSGLDRPAAFLVETVQGEGGLNTASAGWLQKIADLARRHGALLIVDDIQAGCGRTGSFFSFEKTGLKPDIITLAKSLSGMGLPLALALVRPEIDCWTPGEHNGTFRGNNHAFVTATAAIRHFWSDEQFQHEVERKGNLLGRRLEAIGRRHGFPARGRGMMRGLDAGSTELARDIASGCFERGLIIETSGAFDEVVKILAPLTIQDDELEAGLSILEESIGAATRGRLGLAAA